MCHAYTMERTGRNCKFDGTRNSLSWGLGGCKEHEVFMEYCLQSFATLATVSWKFQRDYYLLQKKRLLLTSTMKVTQFQRAES